MSDFNMISDQELNGLLKAKLLESSGNDTMSEKLLELQAKIVFAGPALSAPVASKESDLLSKFSAKTAGKFSAPWLLTTIAIITTIAVTGIAFMYSSNSGGSSTKQRLQKFSRTPLQVSNTVAISAESKNGTPQTKMEAKMTLPTAVLTYVDSTPVSTKPPVSKVSDAKTSDTKTATPSMPLAVSETIVPALSPELPPTKDQACRVKKVATTTPVLFTPVKK